MCVCSVLRLSRALCNPMDRSSPGSSVHGILQVRILKWAAYTFSRGSSLPRKQTEVSCIAGRFFTSWASREALYTHTHTHTHTHIVPFYLSKSLLQVLGELFGKVSRILNYIFRNRFEYLNSDLIKAVKEGNGKSKSGRIETAYFSLQHVHFNSGTEFKTL